MKRKVKRFNGESGSSVDYEPLSDEDKQLLNTNLEEMQGEIAQSPLHRSVSFKDEERHKSSYMPTSTYKQQDIGNAKNDNIQVRKAAKPVALKKAEPSKTKGLGMAGSDKGSKNSESRTVPEFKRQGEFPEAAKANKLTRLTGIATEEGRTKKAQDYERQRRQAAAERKALAAQTRAAGVTDTGTLRRSRMDAYVPVDEQSIYSGFKKGGKVKSASARADGIAIRGKTRA